MLTCNAEAEETPFQALSYIHMRWSWRRVSRSRLFLPLMLTGNILFADSASASGFALQNQNGAGTGYAYAGAAAVAEDASTIYFNPAGMTYLSPRHHVSGALSILVRSLKFNDAGSNAFLGHPLGDNGGQAGGVTPIPAVYWSMPVTPALRIGLGVSATFGSSTGWSNTFIGRYQGVSSEMTVLNANPSVAWRMNNVISFGAGFNLVRIDANLRGMIPVTPLADTGTKLTGNDIGFGYNLGAMFQITPATRLGITYRSTVDLKVEGRLGILGNSIPASVPIVLPDTASVALSHMVNNRLQLLGDFTWTGWSSISALVARSRIDGSVLSNEELGLKNSYRLGLGMQYQYSDNLRLRLGTAFDQSPVRNAMDRTVRFPDSDRTWLAAGFNRKISEHTSIDVGYAHVFFDKAEIDRATLNNPLLQLVQGSFRNSTDIISIQFNHRF